MLYFTSILIFSTILCGYCKLIGFETSHSNRTKLHINLGKIYATHFRAANTINVRILKGESNNVKVDSFANGLMKNLYMQKAIVLSTSKMNIYPPYKEKLYGTKIKRDKKLKHRYISDDEMFRRQRFSSDPQDIYLIVVWDPDTLNIYLNANSNIALNKARSIYSIFFVFQSEIGCSKDLEQDIINILLRLWIEFKILNVVVSAPFSCFSQNIYIYNPFKRAGNNDWGVLRIHNVNLVVKYPHLIFNDLINLNGFPLNVSLFERSPTAIRNIPKGLSEDVMHKKIKKISNFDGLDASILATIALYLNFTISNGYDYGYFGVVLDNGTITGSLEQVVRNYVQISANGRFITSYNTSGIEFTAPYSSDQICIIVPKSERVPQWLIVFRCFRWSTWLFIGAVFILCGVIWSLSNTNDISKSWLEVFSIFTASPITLPHNNRISIFLGSCMVVNVITAGIFQGTLVRSFSTLTYYPDIDTLEDLDKSNLPIYTSFSIFGSNESKLIKRLSKKTRSYIQNIKTLDEVAYKRRIAGVERKQDAELFLSSQYVGASGNPLLHIVKECPISYFVAYIVPFGSPLVPRINWVLRKFTESGLVDKWYQDTVDSLILEFQIKVGSKKNIEQAFSISDLQTAFFILIFGSVLSGLVFVYELVLSHRAIVK